MKQLHKKLLKYSAQDRNKTELEVLTEWNDTNPHFNGTAGHRYQGQVNEYMKTKQFEVVCVYCLRPKTYKKE